MRLAIGIVFAIVTWYLARRKGFNPWLWFLAGGPLGFVVLLCVPSAIRAPDDDARARRKQSGDMLGLMLTAFVLAFELSLLTSPVQSGGSTGARPFIALASSLLMLAIAVLLARSMDGPWKYLLVLVAAVATAWLIPDAILAAADVPWLKSAYQPESGLYWHTMSKSAYFGMYSDLFWLYTGALLLVAVAASRTAHGSLQLRVGGTGQFDARLLGLLLILSLLVLGLGIASGIASIAWAIAAALLMRRIGMPWWIVAVTAVPKPALDLAFKCAFVFNIDWLKEVLGVPGWGSSAGGNVIRTALFSGIGWITSVGLLYVAAQLSRALRPADSTDSRASDGADG